MQIKPRQNLLEVWQAVARHSFDGGEWDWGEWGGRSSVADAERLLCLLYPATEITAFRLDDPDTTQRDVERALRSAGDSSEIPGNLVKVLSEFMEQHRGEESPTFSGGYYFAPEDPRQELTKEQRAVGVVDAYSMSVTLCLATLGFLKVYRGKTQRASTLAQIDRLWDATSARLTAAMVSLLRSFTVNVVDVSSDQGQALTRLLGQGRLSERQVLQHAIGFDAIRAGDVDLALCGGADALRLKTFTGFYRLGTIAPERCGPFDKDRKGILTGEGAGILVLESLESALARGARIYAEGLGYGLHLRRR
ncbi:hypothetical protein SANTM175S_10555 [Streptomyces antimycoticus]